jgi:hypothetical protein
MRFLLLLFPILGLSINGEGRSVRDTSSLTDLLQTGSEFVKMFAPENGNPFFPVERNLGSVTYHGNRYDNLELLYDCEDDAVVIRDLKGQLKLRLVREKLDAFEVDGHRFVKLRLTDPQGEFYEELHNGRRQLLVQWQKKMAYDTKQTSVYTLRKSIFLLEDGKRRSIERLSDLLAILPDKKKTLRRIYAEQPFRFRKNPVSAAQQVVRTIEKRGW